MPKDISSLVPCQNVFITMTLYKPQDMFLQPNQPALEYMARVMNSVFVSWLALNEMLNLLQSV